MNLKEKRAMARKIAERLIENPKLLDELKDRILNDEIVDSSVFKVTIDYSQTLDQMIAAGKFDWKSNNITEENFPREKTRGKEKVELNLELIHFNRYIKSDQAIAELKKLGLRPATLPELLAFATRYPEKQREFLIVALGSVERLRNNRFIPVLWGDSDARCLDLDWFGRGCSSDYRLLAVREV